MRVTRLAELLPYHGKSHIPQYPRLQTAVVYIAATYAVCRCHPPQQFTQALGADLPPYFYPILAVTIGVPTLGFIGFDMWQKLAENRRIRRERRQQEAIEEVG